MAWLSRDGASLHSIVDAHAASHPDTIAAVDDTGEWTYAQLRDASLRLAAVLQARGVVGQVAPAWATQPLAPRPLALAMPRGRTWYALCLATWRLGVPLVAASDDMKDKKAECDRNTRIATELRPTMLVVNGDAEAALPSRPSDCVVCQVEELLAEAELINLDRGLITTSNVISPESVLMYAYTGGTTKHSKCVVVTNAMALWEMDNYGAVLNGSMRRSDRVLQYSPSYWGASAFGQIDIGLAFGACIVFVPAPASVDEVTAAVSRHSITVLGTVPSQLRGAFPGGPPKSCPVRVVLTWGEKLPVKLARQWKTHSTVIELLIASEYWLALSSHCSTWHDPADSSDKHILQPLKHLDMLLVGEDGSPTQEGEIGEMYLTGPTMSPGYVGPDRHVGTGKDNEASYKYIDGRLYYRTKDRLRKLAGGGLIYMGRGDSLAKRGGAWVDLEAMEDTAAAFPGVAMAAIVATEEVHLFIVLEANAQGPMLHLVERVKKAVGGDCRMHVVSELPRNAATDKVDRKRLQQQLSDAGAREVEWQRNVAQVQWQVLRSYLSWYVLVFFAVAIPSFALPPLASALGFGVATPLFALLPLASALGFTALRLLLLPYLWGVWQYTLMHQTERRFQGWPFGPPDMMLLLSAFLPSVLLGPVFAAAFGVIEKYRDRNTFFFLGLTTLSPVLLWAGLNDYVSPPISVLLAFLSAACLDPRLVPFFAGLPVSCYLIFPRSLGEDFAWRARCDYGHLRRAVVRFLTVPRPVWDITKVKDAVQFDNRQAGLDWGMTRFSVVKLEEKHEGMGIEIKFRNVTPELPFPAIEKNSSTAQREQQADWSPSAVALAALIERVGGSQDSLVGLDSLQVITLAELIRKEMGKDVSVRTLLRSTDIKQLAIDIETTASASGANCGAGDDLQNSAQLEKPDAFGSYRVFTMAFPRHPVDWCFRYDGAEHMDVAAMQRAIDRLIARHSALRTVETPDEPLRESMDRAAAVWQLFSSSIGRDSLLWRSLAKVVGSSLYACWPRTVLRSADEARIEPRIPKGPRVRDAAWDAHPHDEYIYSSVKHEVYSHGGRWPFEIVVVPLYKGEPAGTGKNAAEFALTLPREDVSWYIYCSITHAYSDGASGQSLIADLIRYYNEEVNPKLTTVADPAVPEVLELLQSRLRPSLRGRLAGESDANNDVFHEVLDEDWVKRSGFSRRIYLEPIVAQSLRLSSSDVLGCSVDVAWLTAVMGSCFRLFPDMPCFHMVLKCGCRDGPGERQMVGFLSENRVFSVDAHEAKTCTLVDIANQMAGARRQRAWRAPLPFESGMTIYINIVSAMIGSLPQGFVHVPKPSPPPNRWLGPAYAYVNLRIDQVGLDDWDIRFFHWDAAWGWEWSTHFSHALGGVIYDMVSAPTEPLAIPPHRRVDGGWPKQVWSSSNGSSWSEGADNKRWSNWDDSANGGGVPAGEKRKDLSDEAADIAAVDAEQPPAKAPRLETSMEDYTAGDAADTEAGDAMAVDAEAPSAKAPQLETSMEDSVAGDAAAAHAEEPAAKAPRLETSIEAATAGNAAKTEAVVIDDDDDDDEPPPKAPLLGTSNDVCGPGADGAEEPPAKAPRFAATEDPYGSGDGGAVDAAHMEDPAADTHSDTYGRRGQ